MCKTVPSTGNMFLIHSFTFTSKQGFQYRKQNIIFWYVEGWTFLPVCPTVRDTKASQHNPKTKFRYSLCTIAQTCNKLENGTGTEEISCRREHKYWLHFIHKMYFSFIYFFQKRWNTWGTNPALSPFHFLKCSEVVWQSFEKNLRTRPWLWIFDPFVYPTNDSLIPMVRWDSSGYSVKCLCILWINTLTCHLLDTPVQALVNTNVSNQPNIQHSLS